MKRPFDAPIYLISLALHNPLQGEDFGACHHGIQKKCIAINDPPLNPLQGGEFDACLQRFTPPLVIIQLYNENQKMHTTNS